MCFEFVVLLFNLIFFLVDGFLPNPDHRFGLFQVGLNLHVGCNHVICLCQFYFSVDQRKLAKTKSQNSLSTLHWAHIQTLYNIHVFM